MNQENKFWLYIWCVVAVVAISVISAVALVNWRADVMITELTRTGVDPVKARCALKAVDSISSIMLCTGNK